MKIATPSTYLGLPTIFGHCVNQYSATAIEPVEACFIDISTFKQLIFENGKFAFEIISSICRDELSTFKRYVNQTHRQIPGRVAGVLVYLSENVYNSDDFELSLTRKEVAELIGTSRESVTRYMTMFKQEGLIDIRKNRISILKPGSIRKIHLTG